MTASPAPAPAPPPLRAEAFDDLGIGAPPSDEILRHLGYPARAKPKAGVAFRIDALLPEIQAALKPRGTYAVYPVSARSPRRIVLADVVIRGEVARFVGSVDRVAVVVATAGQPISDLAEHYAAEGDSLAAWIADSVGSWAAEASADAVGERLAAGLAPAQALSLRYSPGYCGMSMAQQAVLFGLVDASAVGVALLPSMLMRPLKSVSGIVGIGPVEALAAAPRSPCEACHRLGCHMRR